MCLTRYCNSGEPVRVSVCRFKDFVPLNGTAQMRRTIYKSPTISFETSQTVLYGNHGLAHTQTNPRFVGFTLVFVKPHSMNNQ